MSGAIAVVVVSYQSAATLDECLARLRGAHDVVQIRVVDNASDDGSLGIVQRHALADARVRFIANPDNPGFASACNQGARECRMPWLAFINPDLMVEPDTLAELRSRAERLGDCLLGVEQLDEHGHADEAVRLVAALNEAPESNFLRRNVFKDVEEYRKEGLGEEASLVVRTHLASDAALSATIAALRGSDAVRSVLGVMRVEGEAGR